MRAGMALAALGVGLVGAGCLPPPPPPAGLAVSPTPVNFPTTPPPYNPMPIVQVTVTNSGGQPIHSLVVNGIDVYSVPNLGEPNNCFNYAPTLAALAPGQSCVADIQFCPIAPGSYQDQLDVTGQDTSGAPVQATTTLNGTAS